MMRWPALAICAGVALWGCAAPPPSQRAVTPDPRAVPAPAPAQPVASAPEHYRCERGTEFGVRFVDDSAFIDSAQRGSDVVLRDAGGVTPQQSVYSNSHLRAEFGLGAAGREATLHYLPDPQVVHCVLQ